MNKAQVVLGRTAQISNDGLYRYSLTRAFDVPNPLPYTVTFVMLNPSTADGLEDDPTIRRCIGFAKAWRFSILNVVNLFAYRATNPRMLAAVADPCGPDNARWLADALGSSAMIVCAWGALPQAYSPGAYFRDRARRIRRPIHHLGLTKDGSPKHPLYLRADTQPQLWGFTDVSENA